MSYGENRLARGEPVIQLHVGENAPQQYNVQTREWQTPSDWLHRGQSSAGEPGRSPIYLSNLIDVGIFKDTLAPSLALHSGLAVAAWGVGSQYDLLEAKDWAWPAGLVVNAWWSAVGRRLLRGDALATVSRSISWPETLLLAGVTAWGTRLFYRVASRCLARGKDDPRYAVVKKEEGFWNKALLKIFIPEAVVQTLIALPFTAPFRHQGGVMSGYHPVLQSLSVGMFAAGFALEALADSQQQAHKEQGVGGLQQDGVWSIVRHPNYVGDALVHASFPLLLFSSDMLAPIVLLGPLANYLYLRLVGGDALTEPSQAERYAKEDPLKARQLEQWKAQKNAFWPGVAELRNQWTWVVVAAGVGGVLLEQGLRRALH